MDLGAGDPASKGGQATIGIRNTNGQNNDKEIAWSHNAPIVANESQSCSPAIAPPRRSRRRAAHSLTTGAARRHGSRVWRRRRERTIALRVELCRNGRDELWTEARRTHQRRHVQLHSDVPRRRPLSPASATDALTIDRAAQTAVTVTGPSAVTYGAPGTATATGGNAGAYAFSAGASTGCSVLATRCP